MGFLVDKFFSYYFRSGIFSLYSGVLVSKKNLLYVFYVLLLLDTLL